MSASPALSPRPGALGAPSFSGGPVLAGAPILSVEGLSVRTRYNPVYATTDNLITAWLARDEMDDD